MIGLLQVGKGHNVESLAAECGVTRRTVFRDLDLLKEAGAPVQYDREFQAYHLTNGYSVPPANLTRDEAIATIVLCHELGGAGRLPLLTKARSAAAKLAANLPDQIRDYVRNAADAIRIQPPLNNPIEGRASIYDDLIESIAKREHIRVRYDSLYDGKIIETRLSPYRIFYRKHAWYVAARSSMHRAVRTFNIGRIRQIDFTNSTYRIPKNFSLERYLGEGWRFIPDRGPNYEVRIRFGKMVARNVDEVIWHRTQKTNWNTDGTLDFRVRTKGLKEMSWWVLGYGDEAQVIGPPQLRKLVATRVRRMAEMYKAG
jgi:predicted DNA-binding transcriptional regulator YafY